MMIETPNLDQLFNIKLRRGTQIRIFDFCLYCPDFGHFFHFFDENWPKMAKIWAIKAIIKNPDLWPSVQFYVEQLVQIWGLYHHFWRRSYKGGFPIYFAIPHHTFSFIKCEIFIIERSLTTFWKLET